MAVPSPAVVPGPGRTRCRPGRVPCRPAGAVAAAWTISGSANPGSSTVSKWNGTVVTLAWGSGDTCSAMASAVRSWSTAVPQAAVLAVGQQHAHLGLAVGQLARHAFTAARVEPAVGAGRPSRAARAGRPRRRHSLGRDRRAASSSIAKWTARSSSGVRVRAYWMARAAAMSRRSTNTSTTWRRRIGAVDGGGHVVLELARPPRSYCRFRRRSSHDQHRAAR